MSQHTLPGVACKLTISTTTIQMVVKNNANLKAITVGKSTTVNSGSYNTTTKTSQLRLVQSDFERVKADLAAGGPAGIAITLTYEDSVPADNNVREFVIPSGPVNFQSAPVSVTVPTMLAETATVTEAAG